MSDKMIAKELTFSNGKTLKNRLCKTAMTEGLADAYGGVTEELIHLYDVWCKESNCGMMITGNVQIDRRFLERPGNVVLDLDYTDLVDKQLENLKKWADIGKKYDTKIIVQVSHGGRQSNNAVAKVALAPSNVKSTARASPDVKEATVEELQRVREKFKYAVQVCKDAGFAGVQIHGAHGYLLSSLLNPLANKRKDDFGGSLENRASLLLQVISDTKDVAVGSDFLTCVKLNSADFQQGGFSPEEAVEVSLLLAKQGVDLLELSGGNYEQTSLFSGEISNVKQKSTIRREAYFLEFAADIMTALKKAESTEMKIMVTGGFRSGKVMEESLQSKNVDILGIGRPLCADPGCTGKLLKGEVDELPRLEAWTLPSLFGTSFMRRFKAIAGMTMGGIMLSCFKFMIEIGHGTFKGPYTTTRHPSTFAALTSQSKAEGEKARALRGYKKDETFLTPLINSNAE